MLILGIDPGTATTGYGLIKVKKDGYKVLKFGLIETDKNGKPEKRLVTIHNNILDIIKEYEPDVMAIEKLFFYANAKTAMRVGQAQGVMLFSAALCNTKVVEYAPGKIKKSIAGNGRANKKEVQKSLRKVLGAHVRSRKHKKTHFDNSADALAVALCHAYETGLKIK
ncbi:MAG: crossover junction endodeoxyribonuclease RuvC [Candidatus Woesebacteria bacterium]|jgi:crossover junction endodeoxyribonuclease RuvC